MSHKAQSIPSLVQLHTLARSTMNLASCSKNTANRCFSGMQVELRSWSSRNQRGRKLKTLKRLTHKLNIANRNRARTTHFLAIFGINVQCRTDAKWASSLTHSTHRLMGWEKKLNLQFHMTHLCLRVQNAVHCNQSIYSSIFAPTAFSHTVARYQAKWLQIDPQTEAAHMLISVDATQPG